MPGQPGRKAFPEPGMKPTRPACPVRGRSLGRAHLLLCPPRLLPKQHGRTHPGCYLRYRPRRQAHPKVNPMLSSPPQHAPHQVRKSHKTPPPITTEQAVTQHHQADSHARTSTSPHRRAASRATRHPLLSHKHTCTGLSDPTPHTRQTTT